MLSTRLPHLYGRRRRPLAPPGGWGRRLGVWVALFALLFNLAGAMVAPAPALADDGLHSLCTAGGMVHLPQADAQTAPGQGASDGLACLFCLPLWHGGTLPAATATPVIAAVVVAVVAPAPTFRFQPDRRPNGPAAPRAPPLTT